jgi:hypothetical protein
VNATSHAPLSMPRTVKENPHFVFRLDHDRAHDGGVKATPLRGGLRPAWTPPPLTRLPAPRRKPAKQRQPQHNQDLTGPAPSWMTSPAAVAHLMGATWTINAPDQVEALLARNPAD